MAIVTEEIEVTPVAVPVARTPTLNSVPESELLGSEALPLLTLLDAGMLTSIQLVRDRSDIQCSLRDLLPKAICQRMHNGISDHILA